MKRRFMRLQRSRLLRIWDGGDPQITFADVWVNGAGAPHSLPSSPVGAGQGHSHPTGFGAAAGSGVDTLGVSPQLGVRHGPGCPGRVVPAWQARGSAAGRGGARWGCGGDVGSPSCRPGVSNEWYEFPARPLIASSKSLNELLLLRLAPRARLMAWPAPPRCRMVLDAPRRAPTATLESHNGHFSPTAAPPSPGC